MTVALATSDVVVREAAPADNAAKCDLFARVTMESDVVLSVRRDPDFDALYRLQSDEWLSLVIESDGVVEGTGSVVIRDGYVGGELRRVGYLGDLRFSPRLQGRMLLERLYRTVLEEVRDRHGCELFLTSVIASNTRALRALTRDTARARRSGRPRYVPVGDFDIRSLHLLLPRFAERSELAVRRATSADVPALARLIDEDQRARPFGFVFAGGELERRLAEWPGLSVDSFYVAEDRGGAVVGCLALWDADPVKRMVVTAYRGSMRLVRNAYGAVARLVSAPPLPQAGGMLRYLYVTHQVVQGNDPAILRALLSRAYRDVRGRGYHFLSVCAPHGGPLEPAFRGFSKTNLAARLFVVALPDVDVSAVTGARAWPGFEMALV